jgi:hypothetical protein
LRQARRAARWAPRASVEARTIWALETGQATDQLRAVVNDALRNTSLESFGDSAGRYLGLPNIVSKNGVSTPPTIEAPASVRIRVVGALHSFLGTLPANPSARPLECAPDPQALGTGLPTAIAILGFAILSTSLAHRLATDVGRLVWPSAIAFLAATAVAILALGTPGLYASVGLAILGETAARR